MEFFTSGELSFILLPLLIFFMRIVDVTLETLRIIFVLKGLKKIAPFVGFFEVLVWVFAISRIMENADNWIGYIAYAGGYAAGSYAGMIIEEKLAIGHASLRVISQIPTPPLINQLTEYGYAITTINALKNKEDVEILFIVVHRKKIDEVVELIKNHDPEAMYTIEDIRSVHNNKNFERDERKKILYKAYHT